MRNKYVVTASVRKKSGCKNTMLPKLEHSYTFIHKTLSAYCVRIHM